MSVMNLSSFIGLRYTRARRRNGFISFISAVSTIGIALGVWALITVMSVMNGFERELRGRILDVAAHVTIVGYGGKLANWQAIEAENEQIEGVAAAAPFVDGQGLMSAGGAVSGALVRGIDPEQEANVSNIEEHMIEGGFDDLVAGEYNVILGGQLARKLGVQVGDKVTLIAPQGQMTAAGLLPRLRRFDVVGMFSVGMNEYDSTLALLNITDAAKLFKVEPNVSGVRLALDDVNQAPAIGRQISDRSDLGYYVTDWTLENRNFFRALTVEKRVMGIILFVIVLVAAFNIVSTLIMVVTDKQADIAIMRTLGMSPRSVMKIFFIQGTMVGVIGVIVGAILGVLTALNLEAIVAWAEGVFGFEFFPADVYVISDFPAQLQWLDVALIMPAALIASMLATLYPAWRASRTQPAEALRYE